MRFFWQCKHIFKKPTLLVDEYREDGLPSVFFRKVYEKQCIKCHKCEIYEVRDRDDKRLYNETGQLTSREERYASEANFKDLPEPTDYSLTTPPRPESGVTISPGRDGSDAIRAFNEASSRIDGRDGSDAIRAFNEASSRIDGRGLKMSDSIHICNCGKFNPPGDE